MTGRKPQFDVLAQLGALRRYARSLTRDAADAEDLVQDALVRAYEKRSSFRRGGNLRAWLLSVMHNAFIDGLRSRNALRRREEATRMLADTSVEPLQDHVVRLAQVREAFFELPDEQRAALHLVAIEGLAYQEASDALGIPIGTLMSRIGRARATLREMETRPRSGNHLRIVGGPR